MYLKKNHYQKIALLWNMDNVIISPHNSWASEMNFRRRYEIAYKNMKKYINNEELINIVDIKKDIEPLLNILNILVELRDSNPP